MAEVRVAAPEALEHLAEALAATSDALTRARIALALGAARFSMGQPPKNAIVALQEGISELADNDDPELALELETQLIGIARHDPDLHALAAERLERLQAAGPATRGRSSRRPRPPRIAEDARRNLAGRGGRAG